MKPVKFITLFAIIVLFTSSGHVDNTDKVSKSVGQAWHANGQLAWDGIYGWHDNGQLAWNGQDKNGWDKNGKLVWNSKDMAAWHSNGQLAWNGKTKTAWYSDGKIAWDIDKGWHQNRQLAGDHLEITLGPGFNIYLDQSGPKLYVAGKFFSP